VKNRQKTPIFTVLSYNYPSKRSADPIMFTRLLLWRVFIWDPVFQFSIFYSPIGVRIA